MIERAVLVEQEGEGAVLFWTTDDGCLEWLSGGTIEIRDLASTFDIPNLSHYRVSGERVYSTPDSSPYRPPFKDVFELRRKNG